MPQKIITLQDVEELRHLTPKRCRLLDHAIVKEKPDGTYVVGTKFASLDRLFQAETGIVTKSGPYGPYLYLSDKPQIEIALSWQEARKFLIFLRDLLDCSLALDFNFAEAGTYTDLGKAEHQAKANADAQAVQYLVGRCHVAATKFGLYKECDSVCAVPPSAGKVWVIACMGILKSRADFYGSASLAACERSWSAWIRNVSEGNSPGGTVHRAAYLYSVGSWNPNHDAIIRIGGEVPG